MNEEDKKRGGGKMIVVSLVGFRKKVGRVLRLLAILIILILLISSVMKLFGGDLLPNAGKQADGTLIKLNYLLPINQEALHC